MTLDPVRFTRALIEKVKSAITPLEIRIEALERRSAVKDGRDGRDGKDADPALVTALREEIESIRRELHTLNAEVLLTVGREIHDGLAAIPRAKDGTSVTVDDVAPLVEAVVANAIRSLPPAKDGVDGKSVDPSDVEALVAHAVAALPTPKDGTSVTVDDVMPWITLYVKDAIAALPVAKDGLDGKAVDPADVEALVAHAVAALPPAKDGTSVTLDDLTPVVEATVAKAVAALPPAKDGVDGRSVDPGDVDALVEHALEHALAVLPWPKDGTSVTVEDLAPVVADAVEKAVALLPPAKDGKDAALPDLEPMIGASVEKALATWTRPKDGTSVTVDDVVPVITAHVDQAVKALPVPKDGVGMMDALLDRGGHLVVTLSDGTTKTLGVVVGADVDMAAVREQIAREVALLPRPKDGVDGKDGLGFEDLQFVVDDVGRPIARFQRGDLVKEQPFPCLIYLGVFKEGTAYHQWDAVTWAGSLWIAMEDTTAKPNDSAPASRAWRLAVKKGSDGKNGLNGKDGANGRDGKDKL